MPKRKDGPDPVDVIVGQNVRNLRVQRGLSQEKLGEALAITFQQIQKYEKGTNRIASSNLVRIADTLGVTIATLFHGVKNEETGADQAENEPRELLTLSPKAFQVGKLWDGCDDAVKRSVLSLLRSVTDTNGSAANDDEGSQATRKRA